jgi:hypothetical protein
LQSTGIERDHSIEELADIALKLQERVNLSPTNAIDWSVSA